jgi:hypothetical protein
VRSLYERVARSFRGLCERCLSGCSGTSGFALSNLAQQEEAQHLVKHLCRGASRFSPWVRGSKNSFENPPVHTNHANTPKQTRWIASLFIKAQQHRTESAAAYAAGKREESALRRDCRRDVRQRIADEHVAFECRNFPSSACQIYDVHWWVHTTI